MTNDTSQDIHENAPTDGQGRPLHPENDYHICGANKSDKTTETPHGRERDDYEYCLQRAGKGTNHVGKGRCSNHGGCGGAPEGEKNGSYKGGAYSAALRERITEEEEDLIEDFIESTQDPTSKDAKKMVQEAAAMAFIRFNRGGDPSFLREYRQLCSEFNLVDATDHVAVSEGEDWYDNLRAAQEELETDSDEEV